jgi:hypothetical protein
MSGFEAVERRSADAPISTHGVGELARTFEILSPTVRMEAIAATAISETIKVYSNAMAPR